MVHSRCEEHEEKHEWVDRKRVLIFNLEITQYVELMSL